MAEPQIAYYIKFAGVPGAEKYRGGSGWSLWDGISINNGQKLPSSSVGGGGSARPYRISCYRQSADDDTLRGLMILALSADQIRSVEIVGVKVIFELQHESRTGRDGSGGHKAKWTGPELLHVTLTNVDLEKLETAGRSCYYTPGVHIPRRVQDNGNVLPEVDAPSREHCVTSDSDTVDMNIAAADVRWLYPVPSN